MLRGKKSLIAESYKVKRPSFMYYGEVGFRKNNLKFRYLVLQGTSFGPKGLKQADGLIPMPMHPTVNGNIYCGIWSARKQYACSASGLSAS